MISKDGSDEWNPSIQKLNHQLFLILLINAHKSKRIILHIRKKEKS